MKEIKVTVNTWYVVEGAAGATVINPLTNRAIATVEDGKQASFLATTPYVVASDDSVSVFKAPFNSAPAKLKLLGLLGGGNSELPAGYTRLEFLESTGTQWVTSPTPGSNERGARAIYSHSPAQKQLTGWAFCAYNSPNTSNIFGALRVNLGSASPFKYGWKGLPTFNVGEEVIAANTIYKVSLNFKNDMKIKLQTPTALHEGNLAAPANQTTEPVHIAGINSVPQKLIGRLYLYEETRGSEIVHHMTPALGPTGTPCMFDLVTKKPFRNSGTGQFIVGMTLEQARKLGKLPAGTKLTVSLPVGYDLDAGVVAALAEAEANGCELTIQTYEAAASAASTFGMRRIWVRRTQDENGTYIAGDGFRWQVDWCVDIIGADPEQEGYEPFRSVDAAVAYWELAPYVDPAWENELLTNQEL